MVAPHPAARSPPPLVVHAPGLLPRCLSQVLLPPAEATQQPSPAHAGEVRPERPLPPRMSTPHLVAPLPEELGLLRALRRVAVSPQARSGSERGRPPYLPAPPCQPHPYGSLPVLKAQTLGLIAPTAHLRPAGTQCGPQLLTLFKIRPALGRGGV